MSDDPFLDKVVTEEVVIAEEELYNYHCVLFLLINYER